MRCIIASDEPLAIGRQVDVMARRYLVVAQVYREECWAQVQHYREQARKAGEPLPRAGFYMASTRRFVPDHTGPPEQFRYWYLLEEM